MTHPHRPGAVRTLHPLGSCSPRGCVIRGVKRRDHAPCGLVLDVEETGIPALELRPERVIKHPGSGLKHQMRAKL